MSWPTSIRQHVHDGDDGRRARNNEKVTKNSNSNKLGPSAATKKVREKKIETGKEGKWSIINFACDLVRFLGLHDNWPQPTLSISLCQNLFPHTLLCVHRFSPSCLEVFRFYEFQINFFFSFHVQHFFAGSWIRASRNRHSRGEVQLRSLRFACCASVLVIGLALWEHFCGYIWCLHWTYQGLRCESWCRPVHAKCSLRIAQYPIEGASGNTEILNVSCSHSSLKFAHKAKRFEQRKKQATKRTSLKIIHEIIYFLYSV